MLMPGGEAILAAALPGAPPTHL